MWLSLGTGPLPLLLAPGLPDWIGADGERVGWVLRDVLFWFDGAGVGSVRLPDLVEDVAASVGGWTASTALGAVRVDPSNGRFTALLSVDEGEPLAVLPGRDCAIVVAVPEHSLVRLADGSSVKLPDAATRAPLLAPFATGVGLVWIDLDRLYRLTDGGIPNGLGSAMGATSLSCGPDGAALVGLEGDTLCIAPRRLAVHLGSAIDVEGARFSPDGLRALAGDEDGVCEIDLSTGKELRRWDGSVVPVGYAPGPIRWDRDAGTLLDAEGIVIAIGFAGASPALGGTLLAGPGGAVWSTDTGSRVREGLGSGLAATDGHHVAVVDEREVRVLNGATFLHGLGDDNDNPVEEVRIDRDHIVVHSLDGSASAFALDGTKLWTHDDESMADPPEAPGVTFAHHDEPSSVVVRGNAWPFPGDGAVNVGGAVWVWTTEGALFALPL